MLRFLRIRNLAVIEAVEVEFQPGFNVLTGETGAGKSILVEAVGLLLGGRTSADLVRTGESQATIEAIFEDGDRELVVRREINDQGRSRSFIDGALATAAALRDLSSRLVELHGQHEHQALLDPLTHLPLLDQFGGLEPLASQVGSAFAELRRRRDELDRSRMDAREKTARLDLIAFQLGEIEKVNPRPGEDAELDTARRVLANAERIQRLCEESYAALYDGEQAALAGLGAVWKRVGELATLDPQFVPYMEARDGIKSQLEDLAFFLRHYADGVEASPGSLHQTEDRLASIDRLKRKYGPTLPDVLDARARLGQERDLLTAAEGRTEALQAAVGEATTAFLSAARDLSARRRTAAELFGRRLESLLGELAMERARFEARFSGSEPGEPGWSERGIDSMEFYVSPNPGEELRPLARIVSGGELSRIMLAMKTLADADASNRTLIFDEVDAGIGGHVADVVGQRLQSLGRHVQVLCITHLPQIAARGASQYRIQKLVRGARTLTTVEPLTPQGRVDELARMIGGLGITDAVRATARDLLAGAAAPIMRAGEGERRKRKSTRG